MVEQIAVNQWKLARIDRSEARIHDPAVPPGEFALAIHRVYLTQVRLERHSDITPKANETYQTGLIWSTSEGVRNYTVLPKVRGLDGVWREIPREVLGDFPQPPVSGDQTAPPVTPKPNGQA